MKQSRTCDELGLCQGRYPACTAQCHMAVAESHVAVDAPRQSPAFAPGTVDGPYAQRRFMGRRTRTARVLFIFALFVSVSAGSMCAALLITWITHGGVL